VGITEILGDFMKGEVIELLDSTKTPFAIARARCSKAELEEAKSGVEVANADDIVLI
jgi:predicted ribosome-associated RNA-binding protein Tma20